MNLYAYFNLMRFHKPVGTLLLWFPTAWALWMANHGQPPLDLIVYFFLGTILMRAAGCVVNDIADRHIDKHVHRTRQRPLTSGQISLLEALSLLLVLLILSLLVVLQLPIRCFYESFFALLVTALYPFCKRLIQAPQLVLGIAFSVGIPMAYTASNVPWNGSMALLFLINFLWIIAYDTIYAMADRVDDLKIGVKSTAIYFAPYDRFMVGLLQSIMHGLWFILALSQHAALSFYIAWGIATMILFYQQSLIRFHQEQRCIRAFSWSVWYGALMWIALILGYKDFI